MAPFHPARLDEVEPVSLERGAYRIVHRKHRARLLSTEGSRRHGGRYNPKGEFGVLYLGESEMVCRAEIRQQVGDPSWLHSGEWICGVLRLSLERVLDLTDEATLEALGVEKRELMEPRGPEMEGYRLTQALARRARAAGFEALKVPSVTSEGANLVVFVENLADEAQLERVETRSVKFESED